jgi:hypothetical protein
MRIWSLHPKYLDTKGLVALWRETLLAKHVLEGRTIGYRNHPQLSRFKKSKRPVERINQYLAEIYLEAADRDYHFDKEKINWKFRRTRLTVTTMQLAFEREHLLRKLKVRDKGKYKLLKAVNTIETHPTFRIVEGEVENWEVL